MLLSFILFLSYSLYGLLFTLYLVNTQRNYWLVREKITDKRNQQILQLEYILLVYY